ncbi:hypothetical protein XhhCFBP4925_22120 [Xanthomonas hortorum pv. hederae]|nr:hypothetical protein XhhCFBP4925_22120 [Xanthomonas hortorum pv. hederae]PUE93401.1 hypothetical protein C7T87_23010 [Xanthomonas hortorum pv. hederae]
MSLAASPGNQLITIKFVTLFQTALILMNIIILLTLALHQERAHAPHNCVFIRMDQSFFALVCH